MSYTIAIAGKGGTGKTTIAALLIRLLAERGTVLAIDGDPSVNLNMALGMPLAGTVGDAREEMLSQARGGSFGAGMSKHEYIEYKINEALVEGQGVDLLAMGRPEGPGCYCAANNMLRDCLDRLAGSYDYVVIDNEAGMEHISRQTTRDIDALLLVSDPSIRGIVAAARMKELIGEIRTRVGSIHLVINKVSDGLPPEVGKAVEEHGLALLATVPLDPQVMEYDAIGRPMAQLPQGGPVGSAVRAMAEKLSLLPVAKA